MKGKFTLFGEIYIPKLLIPPGLIEFIIAAIFTKGIKPYGNKPAFTGIILCKIH